MSRSQNHLMILVSVLSFLSKVEKSTLLSFLSGLAGALLAVVEETNKSDTLDEAGMKKLTGSDVITARPLFRDYITFTATVPVRPRFHHFIASAHGFFKHSLAVSLSSTLVEIGRA